MGSQERYSGSAIDRLSARLFMLQLRISGNGLEGFHKLREAQFRRRCPTSEQPSLAIDNSTPHFIKFCHPLFVYRIHRVHT